jgi:hypothetical protein
MEYKLICNVTLFDGTEVTQSFDCPPDPKKIQGLINQLLAEFLSMGYIKSDENGITAHRVNKANVVVPTILVANPGDVPPPSAGGRISLA